MTNDIYTQRRLELHAKLEAIPGVKKAYFQPPASVKMRYPCIVYHRDGGATKFSDDNPYNFRRRYVIKVIDPDPDSSIPDILANTFPMCTADRHYTSDNLNHDVFTLYY